MEECMPVQHGSDKLLKTMRRGLGSDGIRKRIEDLRSINQDIAINQVKKTHANLL